MAEGEGLWELGIKFVAKGYEAAAGYVGKFTRLVTQANKEIEAATTATVKHTRAVQSDAQATQGAAKAAGAAAAVARKRHAELRKQTEALWEAARASRELADAAKETPAAAAASRRAPSEGMIKDFEQLKAVAEAVGVEIWTVGEVSKSSLARVAGHTKEARVEAEKFADTLEAVGYHVQLAAEKAPLGDASFAETAADALEAQALAYQGLTAQAELHVQSMERVEASAGPAVEIQRSWGEALDFTAQEAAVNTQATAEMMAAFAAMKVEAQACGLSLQVVAGSLVSVMSFTTEGTQKAGGYVKKLKDLGFAAMGTSRQLDEAARTTQKQGKALKGAGAAAKQTTRYTLAQAHALAAGVPPTEEMQRELEGLQRQFEATGVQIEQLEGRNVRLTASTQDSANAMPMVSGALRQWGFQVEEVSKGLDKQRTIMEALEIGIARYGTMRGGILFRVAKAYGGWAAGMAMGLLIVSRALAAFKKASDAVLKTLAKADKLQAASAAYRAWGQTTREVSEQYIADIQRATRYSGEEYEILATANKELLASNKELAASFPTLAEAAFYTARALGEDTASLLESWVEAIKEGDAEALEAEHGFTGLSQAVWELAENTDTAVDELDEGEKQLVILKALLPQVTERTEELSRAQSTGAVDAQNYAKALGEWAKSLVGVIVEPGLMALTGDAEGLARSTKRFRLVMEERRLWEEIKRLRDEGEISPETFDRVLKVGQAVNITGFRLAPVSEQALADAVDYYQRIMEGPKSTLGRPHAAERLLEVAEESLEAQRKLAQEVMEARHAAAKALDEEMAGLTAYGTSAENIMLRMKVRGEELEELYKELGPKIFQPRGLIRLEQFNAQTADGVALLQEWTEQAEELDDAVDDFTLKGLQMGLPYKEALRLGEEMGRQIEELGDLTTVQARYAMGIIEDDFDKMLDVMGTGIDSLAGRMISAAYKIGEALSKEAKRVAVQLAPYTSFENVEKLYGSYYGALTDWQRRWQGQPGGLESLGAMAERSELDKRFSNIARDFERAATGVGQSVSNLKKAIEQALLRSPEGNLALGYEVEHGKSPLEAYARHEEPLTAWMIDEMRREEFQKEMGREPTKDEDEAFWYQYWYPKQLYKAPGAPIAAPGMDDPRAKAARARLAETGVQAPGESIGDLHHDEYLAKKKLIPELETANERFVTMDEALGTLNVTIGEMDDSIQARLAKLKGDRETEEPPVEETEGGGIQEFQTGGYVGRTGPAYLHAGERVMPPEGSSHYASALRELMGGVALGRGAGSRGRGPTTMNMSITIPVSAPVGPQMARDIGDVVAGVGSRLGAQMITRAQRMGLM